MSALAVSTVVASHDRRPPVILVHGAANSGRVWTWWQDDLARRGWSSSAIDLRGHGRSVALDLSVTRMSDYAEDVVAVARELRRPPVLVGWSMGGLAAMMAAAACGARACVGLAPSAPTARRDTSIPFQHGTFGPEEYGITDRDPGNQPMMPDLDREERQIALASLGPESRLARDERKAGIVIDQLRCPLLIVTGSADTQWPAERYRDLPFGAELMSVEGASHWGLVLNRRVVPQMVSTVTAWIERATG